jgi:hypothetical protein
MLKNVWREDRMVAKGFYGIQTQAKNCQTSLGAGYFIKKAKLENYILEHNLNISVHLIFIFPK